MTRLIDADSIPWDVEGVGEIPVITKEEIDQLPTIEAPTVGESVGALPVRHGKWSVPHGHPNARVCSVCMMICHEDSARFYKYCPNCGARMVEDD